MFPDGHDLEEEMECHQQDAEVVKQLQTHKLGLWLALSYSLVTTVTLTITVVSCYKPINFATYHNHTSKYSQGHYFINDWTRKIAKTAMSLLAAVSIPITSAVCAKAAVVHCQKTLGMASPNLTLRQTLALADKGWSDLRILSQMIGLDQRGGLGSLLLLVGALFCSLGMALSSGEAL